MLSASTTEPTRSRGSRSFKTGRYRSFQAVEEHEVDGLRRLSKGLQRVAEPHVHHLLETGPLQVGDGPLVLRGQQLAADDPAAAVVDDGRAQVDRRDAERRAELDDARRTDRSRRQVEKPTLLARHRDECVLQRLGRDRLGERAAAGKPEGEPRQQANELGAVGARRSVKLIQQLRDLGLGEVAHSSSAPVAGSSIGPGGAARDADRVSRPGIAGALTASAAGLRGREGVIRARDDHRKSDLGARSRAGGGRASREGPRAGGARRGAARHPGRAATRAASRRRPRAGSIGSWSPEATAR